MEFSLLNEDFFIMNKKMVKPQHEKLLSFVYEWISSSNPPISRYMDGKKYYLINYSYLSRKLETSYMNIRNYVKRLCGDAISNLKFFSKKLTSGKDGKTYSWFSMDMDLAEKALKKDSRVYKKLCALREKKMTDALFEVEETKIDYPIESISIVNRAIEKYSCYFKNRIPSAFSKPTKNYMECLKKVTDIYKGNFTNPRLYSMSENFNNNKQFKIEDWRKKVDEVKGDWLKVKKLIFTSLDNFNLMHLPMYLPFSKNYLETDFSNWLYDSWNGQSQFVQGIEVPWKVRTLLSEDKADKIFNRLPNKARDAGNEFFDMNNSMGSVVLWESIENMTQWAKSIFKYDYNIRYWVSSYDEVPLKFAEYCKEHDIKVNSTTLDMHRAIESNAPWKWFVDEAFKEHNIRKEVANMWTGEQVENFYIKHNYRQITFWA